MPMAAGAASLGVALAAAAPSTDPPGILAWTAIGAAFCGLLPGFVPTFMPTKGTPMFSAAGVVTPGGGFIVTTGAPMGLPMAAAAGSAADPTAITKWMNVCSVVVNWIGTHASYGPLGLVGFAGIGAGPVTGQGMITFANEMIGPDLADAAGILPDDAEGRATWTRIGAAIIACIKTNGNIMPGAMQNVGPAGPVTGAGMFL